MQTQTLTHSHQSSLFQYKSNPKSIYLSSIFLNKPSSILATPTLHISQLPPYSSQIVKSRRSLLTYCVSSNSDYVKEEEREEVIREGLLVVEKEKSIWEQVTEIVMFTGPATGLWICGPLMSLIDTAVIGQGSSIELAALGPGTVLCDNMSYLFMFLSIATSNLVATSLAKQDRDEVQHQLSVLLFIGLTCGFLMLAFTKFLGPSMLAAFTGSNNLHIVPAANTYVQIRGLAWPAILVGWVAQSASLGMKDSLGPLNALTVATAVNTVGAIVLCRFLDYGIAGAAWATMVSQVIAAGMMIRSLNKKGYNAYTISIPSLGDLSTIFGLAAPVFVMMMSKVAFFSLIVYFATSMGTLTLAAHQVMTRSFFMCTVWGEPLSQAAQSFMPELMYGKNRSLAKARMLMKSLIIIGTTLGLMLGMLGTSFPWLFPKIFTRDQYVIQEMHKVLLPLFCAVSVTPCVLSLEGTLLAGRDLKFVSFAMSGCFSMGVLLLLLASRRGYGLPGCWFALVAFQWARLFLCTQRVLSPRGVLFAENDSQQELQTLKAA